jgi:hypothetical protein
MAFNTTPALRLRLQAATVIGALIQQVIKGKSGSEFSLLADKEEFFQDDSVLIEVQLFPAVEASVFWPAGVEDELSAARVRFNAIVTCLPVFTIGSLTCEDIIKTMGAKNMHVQLIRQ